MGKACNSWHIATRARSRDTSRCEFALLIYLLSRFQSYGDVGVPCSASCQASHETDPVAEIARPGQGISGYKDKLYRIFRNYSY